MRIAYWIVAGVLALFYCYAGGRKVVQTPEQLRPLMQWVDMMPMSRVRGIGTVEVLGAIGLVLPPAVNIAPILALIAAVGLVVLQLLATRVHLKRGEGIAGTTINLVLITLAAVTAWLATTWL